jgi:hypothetical protein
VKVTNVKEVIRMILWFESDLDNESPDDENSPILDDKDYFEFLS